MSNPQGASFNSLAGAPTHYDRLPPPNNYGSRGQQRTFYCTPEFHQTLIAAFTDLWRLCPWGTAEVIASAGAYVAKPGAHGQGVALDIDAIFWKDFTLVTLEFAKHPIAYLAVEAVLHRHFGVVLDHFYNAAHRDHFHVDTTFGVGFRKAGTFACFFKAAHRHMLGATVAVTPSWDADADTAVEAVTKAVGWSKALTPVNNWRSFAEAFAKHAFGLAVPKPEVTEPPPRELLSAAYDVIDRELTGTARKAVETALTAFAESPSVRKVVYGDAE